MLVIVITSAPRLRTTDVTNTNAKRSKKKTGDILASPHHLFVVDEEMWSNQIYIYKIVAQEKNWKH